MKKILTFFILILCLPVFANNTLQQQYENDAQFTLSPMLNLINNDFEVYYNHGKSMYGYLLYAERECIENNKNIDLVYIQKMISNWKQTYNTQLIDNLKYIEIKNEDFQILDENTKQFVLMYNSLIKKF